MNLWLVDKMMHLRLIQSQGIQGVSGKKGVSWQQWYCDISWLHMTNRQFEYLACDVTVGPLNLANPNSKAVLKSL